MARSGVSRWPINEFLFEDQERRLERLVLSDRCLERGLFEPDQVRALVSGEGSYRIGRELKLFTLVSLELWLRSNIDEMTSEPPPDLDSMLEAGVA